MSNSAMIAPTRSQWSAAITGIYLHPLLMDRWSRRPSRWPAADRPLSLQVEMSSCFQSLSSKPVSQGVSPRREGDQRSPSAESREGRPPGQTAAAEPRAADRSEFHRQLTKLVRMGSTEQLSSEHSRKVSTQQEGEQLSSEHNKVVDEEQLFMVQEYSEESCLPSLAYPTGGRSRAAKVGPRPWRHHEVLSG